MKLKRLISIFVVVALLASVVIFPVSASTDYEYGQLLDLLDYGNSAESVTNYQRFYGSATFNYAMPTNDTVSYFDVVFSFWGETSLTEVSLLRQGSKLSSLTFTKISGHLYRAYGSISSRAFNTVGLTFNAADVDIVSYVSIESFKIGTFSRSVLNMGAKCELYTYAYSNSFSHYSGEITTDSWTGTTDYDEAYFNLALYSSSWKKFDYIDFSLGLNVASIVSVRAVFDGIAVPVEVSYLDNTSTSGTIFYVNVRMDLRNLDRSSSYVPELQISGTSHLGFENSIAVYDVTGHAMFTSDNPVLFWFKKTFAAIGDGFNDVVSKLTSGFSSVVNAITGNSSGAEQVGDDMKNAANDLTNIGGAFDQVETPDIDAAALTGDFTNFSPSGLTVLATITNNPYVTALLALVFTFALCAYIFFGRKR